MTIPAQHQITDHDFQRLSTIVHEHCGINLHDGKLPLVQARLTKLLRTSRYANASDYLDNALADPEGEAFANLVDTLSTNLTSFFREATHLTYLGDNFLPELIARKRRVSDRKIRGWIAACSSGEEPYSLAMVTLDTLEKLGADFDARILATDISHRMLDAAQKGVYDRQRTVPVPPALRGKYLVSSAARHGALEVSPALRQVVRFAHLNLMDPWPFSGPFDFIFCRNVMIYFDKPTQQRLINRFWQILASGGLLFTGHSESLTGITHQFRYIQATVYQKP